MAQFKIIEGEGERRSKVRVARALRAIDRWYSHLPFTMLEKLETKEHRPFPAENLARMADRLTDIAWGHFSAQREASRLLKDVREWYRSLPEEIREELEYYGYEFPIKELDEALEALARW